MDLLLLHLVKSARLYPQLLDRLRQSMDSMVLWWVALLSHSKKVSRSNPSWNISITPTDTCDWLVGVHRNYSCLRVCPGCYRLPARWLEDWDPAPLRAWKRMETSLRIIVEAAKTHIHSQLVTKSCLELFAWCFQCRLYHFGVSFASSNSLAVLMAHAGKHYCSMLG